MNRTTPRVVLVAGRAMPLIALPLFHAACAEEEFQMPASTAAEVEQTTAGTQPSATLVASFDGLGFGFRLRLLGLGNLCDDTGSVFAFGFGHADLFR